jgi:hypothetical protein
MLLKNCVNTPPFKMEGEPTVLPRPVVGPYSKVTVVDEPLGLIDTSNL